MMTSLLILPSLLLHFRYPNECSIVGVHPPRPQEAEVQVHGVVGETRGGAVSLQQRPGLCRPVGKTQESSPNVLRQGRAGTSLLLQEEHFGAGRWTPHLPVHKEVEQAVS